MCLTGLVDIHCMLRAGHVLQLIVMALLGFAVVMVHSAGMDVGGGAVEPVAMLKSRHTMYAAAAIVAMLVASWINLRHVMEVRSVFNPALLLLVGSLVLVGLTMVPGVGLTINGARRWLSFGPRSVGVTFQPSELVKVTLVIAVAWWCARRHGVMRRFCYGVAPALVMIGLTCFLVVIEDLGTAVLVGVVVVCMLVAGGARVWQLLLLSPIAAAGVVAAVLHSPYRMKRLLIFLDPWQDAQGAGYQVIQSMLAIAEGGLWGRGLGNGIQKLGYLPTDTSDMLFSIISEELGITGVVFVIGMFLALLWTGLGVIKRCDDAFARLVAFGLLLTIGLQALINIAVATVVVPTKGIALPLLSAGGTGWIVTAFSVGLVASLDNAKYLEELEVEAELDEDGDEDECMAALAM